MHQTTIELSKAKLGLLVLGSCIFVAMGYGMLSQSAAEIEAQRRFNSPFFVHCVGLVGIIFFGLAAAVGIRKLFDDAPGLILTDQGVTVSSAGFIPWSDVCGLEVRKIQNQRILYLLLKDPEEFIATCAPLKRFMLKAGKGFSPSPVAISASSLQISFDDLVSVFEGRLQTHRPDA